MLLMPLAGNSYGVQATGTPVILTGSTNAVPVTLGHYPAGHRKST